MEETYNTLNGYSIIGLQESDLTRVSSGSNDLVLFLSEKLVRR